MFTFFNKLCGRRSAQTCTGTSRPSIRKPAQPRRLELENLEERMVLSPISDKWWSLGGPSGFLGWNTGPETVAPDGIGRYEHFQGGMILWSPADGAHEVHGAILGDYANLGAEMSYLGYPQTDETTTGKGDGRYNRFDGGFIFWSPNSPASALDLHTIFKYASMGYEESALGYPTSDATPIFGSFSRFHLPHIVGYYNTFQNGEIVWSASTNQAVEVQGAIWGEYLATANETDAYGTVVQNILGEPTSDEMDVPGVPGARMSTFQGGTIYWSPDVGAHVVYGGIGAYYVNNLGGPTGYGLPTSDEATYPGAPEARFTNFQNGGSIYWSATVGAHEVHGAINALYQGMGGPSSYLGMPTSDEQGIPFVSRYNYFENGKIVWTPAGAYAVQAATRMTFDSGNFGFDNGVPVNGWAELTVYADGTYHFTGHLHDSGALSYNDNLVVGLVAPSGNALFFVHSGHMAGTFESGSRDDNWDVTGTNDGLANNWADFEGSTAYFTANINADWNPLVNQIEQGCGIVLSVIGIIIAV